MTPLDTLSEVFIAGVVSTMATGLGALPVILLPRFSRAAVGILYSTAAGFMVSASVFTIATEGLHLGTPWEVMLGFLAGGFFMTAASKLLPHDPQSPVKRTRSMLMLIALFAHSIPEGIAIGVGFATGEVAFGLIMTVAISLHNIPEGTAMSLPLHAEGAGFWKCFWYSVLTSAPQAVLAVPSFLLVNQVKGLLPGALAFAGGAMIFIVVLDLLPEAFEAEPNRANVAWGFLVGLTAMMLLTVWVTQFHLMG